MCLILISYQTHQQYPLIVAANRDERFRRKTRLAQFWPDSPHLLAGQDLEAGGTWLGITRTGRFAAITNIRGHVRPNVPTTPLSRGELVSQFLLSNYSAHHYADEVNNKGAYYQGFNLLLFDGKHLVYCNNLADSAREAIKLKPGIYGLSNGTLDQPWPKTVEGKQRLHHSINQKDTIETANLLSLLRDENFPDDISLPDTGVGIDIERILSPLFITSTPGNTDLDGYGTCNSTAITIDKQRQAVFHERSFYQQPLQHNPVNKVYRFTIENI